jgi:hypothetical protein
MTDLAFKMHSLLDILSSPYAGMQKRFTLLFLILLFILGPAQAFGQSPVEPYGHSQWPLSSHPSGATSWPNVDAFVQGQSLCLHAEVPWRFCTQAWPSTAGVKYPGRLDIKSPDFRSLGFMSLYNPVGTVTKVSQIMRLQLEMDKRTENQDGTGPKPMLNLGSIPEVLIRYQSDTVLQWGYSFRDLVLLLRFGIRAKDFDYLDFQTRREDTYLLDLNLNFNFLIDFWFK